ncbi:MAG: 1,4-alpha-glucan branching protein GlgB [Pseudomonadota bacterium]|nr:1,4-alpha-glucan branching protein GlgB [Pseudomonadota bacterium]
MNDISNDTLAAIARGEHGDPFAVLGPHSTRGGWTIHTFQPQAEAVTVVDESDRELAAMERAHGDGVYVAQIKGSPRPYRLRLREGGNERTIDDPYRYGPVLGDIDRHLMGEGTHLRLYEKLGAIPVEHEGVGGVYFGVWAPNARRVSVVGPFNNWDGRRHPMRLHPSNGVWEIFVPGLAAGEMYKFELVGPHGNLMPLKADPFGRRFEPPPGNASIVHKPENRAWQDDAWMQEQRRRSANLDSPIAIYEVHLGSWRRKPEEGNRWLSYRELADELVPYVKELGYTHIELLPVSEHPFDGSWGYQPIGMFAPTWRFGTPEDFKVFVDRCHQEGIGMITDWVPAHFPRDAHGLGYFDGSHLYEHADPRKGAHMDWGTLIFNYGRNEVVNYLLANALFWLEEYHIDSLRVDAVASMLYLDYSRKAGEWIPNQYGGNENLEAVEFLRRMNVFVHEHGGSTMAEESTAWPMVSRPTYLGGLGFTFKWNMGWMHDTLEYIKEDPVHRKYHHDRLTFGLLYAFTENFVLPLSHDEVVHGKGSILARMPGDTWQRFANIRVYYGFMYGHPGKKLLFMGGEFAQGREWNYTQSLDWHLLDDPLHAGVQRLVRDLNRLYTSTPALYELDTEHQGFEWIDANDRDNSVISFVRRGRNPDDFIVVVCNFTPVVRHNYRIGVPAEGSYREALNTDARDYGGSGVDNGGLVQATTEGAYTAQAHGRPYSMALTLPPLAAVFLKPER